MLFNSHAFIFLFCPVVFLVYYVVASASYRAALAWMVAASLFFYAWWNPPYVFLLAGSAVFNYLVGAALDHYPRHRKPLLAAGVGTDLLLLGYFKYTNFFIDTLNAFGAGPFATAQILLPLAISFHTFQQIAYLVDTYRGETRHYRFLDYLFFVVFFPQLIAGPIVRHDEIIPQIAARSTLRFDWRNAALGITFFSFGLFKKVVIADYLSQPADLVFNAAGATRFSFFEGWLGAVAYALQIYFDFSAYSDMAIGLALFAGIRFPLNFFSPYQARSIIEFWRRWHMTLSRFLLAYLYIPLGGNRRGRARRYLNLMLTMLLGGLWHGAAWTYVAWGGLHGAYLIVNHAWRSLPLSRRWAAARLWGAGSFLLTFGAVCIAWVFFRAGSFAAALEVLSSMLGRHGMRPAFSHMPEARHYLLAVSAAGLLAFFAPNIYVLTERFAPTLTDIANFLRGRFPAALAWRPVIPWALAAAGAFATGALLINRDSPFLYFQF